MNILTYISTSGNKKEVEIGNTLDELLEVFYELPEVPGCSLTYLKSLFKLKFQVANNGYFQIYLYYKNEEKSLLEKSEYGEKAIKIFLEDEFEFVRLFDNPLGYFVINENLQQNDTEKNENPQIQDIENNDSSAFITQPTQPEKQQHKVQPISSSKTINKENSEAYKVYKGKKYSKSEWEKFEEEQFKIYAKKNNIKTNNDNENGTSRFFLGEKKYEQ